MLSLGRECSGQPAANLDRELSREQPHKPIRAKVVDVDREIDWSEVLYWPWLELLVEVKSS